MVKLFSLFTILVLGFCSPAAAQNYYVFLSQKCPDQFNPEDFDHKAIERREKLGLSFPSENDLPLCPEQISTISSKVEEVRYELRWLQALTVTADPEQISEVAELPFVSHIEPMQGYLVTSDATRVAKADKDSLKHSRLVNRIRQQMGFDSLAAWDLHGRGVRIAIFDVGFNHVDKHQAFDYLRKNKKILKTRDFYGKDAKVYHHHYHGTSVLSCIAGRYGNSWIGEAYEAEFLLARTEHLIFEKIIEEDHWLAAMEWADREGADIITSSLGYNEGRYTYADMDGKTAKVSRAATTAFEKGILVVNSMGNEGDSKFRYLGAPADSPEVLSIGASNPVAPLPLGFSSEGPNADGVLKPELAAPGAVLTATKKDRYTISTGTSFSAPLVTGLAACLMEKYPDKTNQEIKQLLMDLGHRHPYYDYYLGYGIPNAANLVESEDSLELSLSIEIEGDTALITFSEPAPEKSQVFKGNPILYYQFVDRKSKKPVEFSNIMVPAGTSGFKLAYPKDKRKRESLRIWYEGFLLNEE